MCGFGWSAAPDVGALWCVGSHIYEPRASRLVELRSGRLI